MIACQSMVDVAASEDNRSAVAVGCAANHGWHDAGRDQCREPGIGRIMNSIVGGTEDGWPGRRAGELFWRTRQRPFHCDAAGSAGSVTATRSTALAIGESADAAQGVVGVNLNREGVLIRCVTATSSKCEDTIHAVCLFSLTKNNADIRFFR